MVFVVIFKKMERCREKVGKYKKKITPRVRGLFLALFFPAFSVRHYLKNLRNKSYSCLILLHWLHYFSKG